MKKRTFSDIERFIDVHYKEVNGEHYGEGYLTDDGWYDDQRYTIIDFNEIKVANRVFRLYSMGADTKYRYYKDCGDYAYRIDIIVPRSMSGITVRWSIVNEDGDELAYNDMYHIYDGEPSAVADELARTVRECASDVQREIDSNYLASSKKMKKFTDTESMSYHSDFGLDDDSKMRDKIELVADGLEYMDEPWKSRIKDVYDRWNSGSISTKECYDEIKDIEYKQSVSIKNVKKSKISKRCPNGYHKNPKTGECVSNGAGARLPDSSSPNYYKTMRANRVLDRWARKDRGKRKSVSKMDDMGTYEVDNPNDFAFINEVYSNGVVTDLENDGRYGFRTFDYNGEKYVVCEFPDKKSENNPLGIVFMYKKDPEPDYSMLTFDLFKKTIEDYLKAHSDDDLPLDEYTFHDEGNGHYTFSYDGLIYELMNYDDSGYFKWGLHDALVNAGFEWGVNVEQDTYSDIGFYDHSKFKASAKKSYTPKLPSFRDMTNKMRNTRNYRMGD